jgi:hypothetical protein
MCFGKLFFMVTSILMLLPNTLFLKPQVSRPAPEGAGQNRYQCRLSSGSHWQGFAILIPELLKLAVFQ